jgi:hypothetical protein
LMNSLKGINEISHSGCVQIYVHIRRPKVRLVVCIERRIIL